MGRRAAGLIPDLLGVAALVLPFSYGISPLEALANAELAALGAPLFLAVPIAAWQIRRALGLAPTSVEIAIACALSAAAMVTLPARLLLSSGTVPPEEWSMGEQISLAVFGALLFGNVLLAAYRIARRAPRHLTAGAFLHGGYVPHAALLLAGFWGEWDWGAWLVLAALGGYSVRFARSFGPAPAGAERAGTRIL